MICCHIKEPNDICNTIIMSIVKLTCCSFLYSFLILTFLTTCDSNLDVRKSEALMSILSTYLYKKKCVPKSTFEAQQIAH